MAASAIGGWIASAGIAKLVDQVCSYAGDQYKYHSDDAKQKLRRLEKSLWKIQAVVHKAESLQTKNPSMGNWLGSIKDAAYHAEDVLDKFDYQVLEAKAEHMAKVTTNSSDCSTAGSSSSTTSTTTITTASTATTSSIVAWSARIFERFLFSDKDLNELIAIVGRFDEIASEMTTFLDLVKLEERGPQQSIQWRRTTSMLGTTTFFGRDDEETQLKKLIEQTNDDSNQPYSVIAVVGLAGVGKTALVQRVYTYFRDTAHFDFMVWIHVSETFDVERLTKEMVQSEKCHKGKRKRDGTYRVSWHSSISANWNSNSSLDRVQRIFQDKLKGKTILLIFDDVWNDMSSQWDNLCKPLQFANKGSKVVLTTRSQKVAKINGATETMHLDGLKDEDYCRHFMKCAFGNVTPADFPQLENIGKLLAKKLAGSPLAAMTLGSKLKLRLHEHHWRALLGRKLWQIEQKEDDIIPALRLSYEHLPNHLKQCFVYFALFPKNYPFHADVLIQMWRAQGYIQKEIPDESAHSYIEDLLQLSFIRKAANLEDHYIVHDLLHEFAEWVSNGEHFRIEDNFHVSVPGNVRHLYVNASNISKVFISLAESKMKKNLRSLIICKHDTAPGEGIPASNFNKALEETLHLHELRSLRVFILRHPDGILPDNIEHLVHLRYLDINESRIFSDVPRSLFKLYHLQGLILQSQYKDKIKVELQKGINRLTQLRYLKAPVKIISGIEQIGRLTFLHELKEYHAMSDSKHSIGQLKELNELRGKLTIKNLENVRRREAYDAKLVNKQNLNRLSFCWNQLQESNSNTEHECVFEGLQPNCNLRELNVSSYMGAKSPTWLTREYLPNIQTIELVSCHHWKTLPAFGSLPFLRILKIRFFTALEKIDAGFYGDGAVAFPSLEELSIGHMKQWKEWSGIESSRCIFPRLHIICIKHCQQLMGPLPLPVSSKGINMSVSDWLSANISTNSEDATSDSMKFHGIHVSLDRFGLLFGCILSSVLPTIHMLNLSSYKLISFSKGQEEWLQKLTSVKEVRFTDCAKLTSLPSNMVHLTSLQSLYIKKCPELKSFPHMGLPLSLKELSIIECHNDLSELCSQIKISDINVILQDIKRESKQSNAKKKKCMS
ncbi:hypothetical protein ACP70R_011987 [Stipagrostis hirtigluma subsp. patula]